MEQKLLKSAYLTDIHFGKKANSELHNQDCINFIKWFCEQVKADPEIDNIMFLGDWHENRSSLNISTLNYSYEGAKLLNDLNLPVYFIIGNHDLYYRNTRDLHSVIPFKEFENFILIDEPIVIEEVGEKGVLMCPYLFHEEYKDLAKYNNIPIWAGHFEFKGFVVTGHNIVMPTGPDPEDFNGPKHIFSGHFHKRQSFGNVVYIGNTFPMDFGDAGDNERGMAIYDHKKDHVEFRNWPDCPKYIKTTLSSILAGKAEILPNAQVKCIVDVPVSFEESTYLKQKFTEDYQLREFVLEESDELRHALSETESNIITDVDDIVSVDELVIQMLQEIESEHLDNNRLIEIYKKLK